MSLKISISHNWGNRYGQTFDTAFVDAAAYTERLHLSLVVHWGRPEPRYGLQDSSTTPKSWAYLPAIKYGKPPSQPIQKKLFFEPFLDFFQSAPILGNR
uniref:Uncharacterized protein n=1 Tax=Romanomermis culicivorax TaxID=13658 RepID=A0A915K637_ROMCU